MLPNVYYDFEYRQPVEAAEDVIRSLQAQWRDLPDAARAELGTILDDFKTELRTAQSGFARGTVVVRLLYALEQAPATPAGIAESLRLRHVAKGLGGLTQLGADQARRFIDSVDGLISPEPTQDQAEAPPEVLEVFPDRVATALDVIARLNQRWGELSLQKQDQVAGWLRVYQQALDQAADDSTRIDASDMFLSRVKGDPDTYNLVLQAFVRSARPGPQPTWTMGGAQSMTADAAAGISQLIGRNPALPAPPLPQIATAEMEESSGSEPSVSNGGETSSGTGGAAVDFHTDVRFPKQVSTFERNIPLRVRLTLEKSTASAVDETMSFVYRTPEPKLVLVVCNAEGFTVDKVDLPDGQERGEQRDPTRTILVYMDRDSQWAIFLLTPDLDAGPGIRHISLDFVHEGRLAGTASFQVEVRDRPPVDQTRVETEPVIVDRNEDGSIAERVGGGLSLAAPDAPKPDFVLRIALSADRHKISYTLHSPTGKLGMVFRDMGSVTLQSDPRTFLENTLLRLSQMARASRKNLNEAQIKAHQDRLREIGWNLYEQLFTPQLRQAYLRLRQLREKEGRLDLLIVSDEPWIPWEMVLPDEGLPGEDFLCAQFGITRWLAGHGLPEDFGLQQVQVVVPQSNLASVKQEQNFFRQELPKLRSGITVGDTWLDTAQQVKDALSEGKAHLFHFACHGDFDASRPDESVLQLSRGDTLTPSQIVGPARAGVAKSRPLVFLNACHTGEREFSLTRMGGWAERFVRAGASAFVGSLWEVNDELAAKFAIKFYTELLAGQTLGDAFHAARADIRREDDANPTWLAYTLYADPNGKVKSQ